MLITWQEYQPQRVSLPVPKIEWLNGFQWFGSNSILFEAKFNQADRRILDYEPEIYLCFAKTKDWHRQHTNRRAKRIAHTPQTNSSWTIISLKADVNPRLRATPSWRNFQMNTEWVIDPSEPSMRTQFLVSPFQFLWLPSQWSAWVWSFPISIKDWNRNWTWTEFPPTLQTESQYRADQWISRQKKTLVIYFQLVIRNPKWWYPIHSDYSQPIILTADNNVTYWSWVEYTNRQVSYNYNTR